MQGKMPYLVRSISEVLPCADQIATEIGIESGSISTESDRSPSPGGAWALDQLRESCFGRAGFARPWRGPATFTMGANSALAPSSKLEMEAEPSDHSG